MRSSFLFIAVSALSPLLSTEALHASTIQIDFAGVVVGDRGRGGDNFPTDVDIGDAVTGRVTYDASYVSSASGSGGFQNFAFSEDHPGRIYIEIGSYTWDYPIVGAGTTNGNADSLGLDFSGSGTENAGNTAQFSVGLDSAGLVLEARKRVGICLSCPQPDLLLSSDLPTTIDELNWPAPDEFISRGGGVINSTIAPSRPSEWSLIYSIDPEQTFISTVPTAPDIEPEPSPPQSPFVPVSNFVLEERAPNVSQYAIAGDIDEQEFQRNRPTVVFVHGRQPNPEGISGYSGDPLAVQQLDAAYRNIKSEYEDINVILVTWESAFVGRALAEGDTEGLYSPLLDAPAVGDAVAARIASVLGDDYVGDVHLVGLNRAGFAGG